MRRRFTTLAAMSLLALALSATPALAGTPAVHGSWSAVGGDPISCGANTYTITAGTIYAVERLGVSASGNVSGAETYTVRNLVVQDQDGTSYHAVGAERFGEILNARTGVTTATYVFKFQILGTADSLNVVWRVSPNGEFSSFGPGTCAAA